MEHKLENPQRLKELNPSETLKNLGLGDGSSFCDIGAGTGIFTFAASKLTNSNIYAVDISTEMLEVLKVKRTEHNADNVILKNDVQDVPSSSCDIVLASTVFHELEDMDGMANEIKRILTNGGLLAVIEFHKRKTPIGPPTNHRLSPEQIDNLLQKHEFNKIKYFELGENFYISIFTLNS